MKHLLILLMILISGSSFSQQWTTMRLTPGTTTLPSGNGWMRYYSTDHKLQMRINDTVRNVATEEWVSKSGGLWKVSGTTNVTTPTISGSVTFTGGRVQFTPDATTEGINVGAYNGTPSSVANGALWYNPSTNRLHAYINSTTAIVPFVTGVTSTRIPFFSAATGLMNTNASLTFASGTQTLSTSNISLAQNFVQSSGTSSLTVLDLTPTLNTTATYSGIVRGLYWNPTRTSTTGLDERAIETTGGRVILTLSQDDTKDRVIVQDASTKDLYWRDVSTVGGGITGTISSARVAFGTGSDEIGGEDGFEYSSLTKTLLVGKIMSSQVTGLENLTILSGEKLRLISGTNSYIDIDETEGITIDSNGLPYLIKNVPAKNSDTVIVMNNGIGYKLMPDIQYVDETLTASEVNSSATSPVVLVDCPVNHTIVITSPVWVEKSGANAFSFDGSQSVQVNCGAQTSDSFRNALASGTNKQLVSVNLAGNLNTQDEKDILFRTTNGGNPTGGSGATVRVRFTYIVLPD